MEQLPESDLDNNCVSQRKSEYILFFCFYNETNSGFQFHFWMHAGTKTKTIIYLFSDSIFKFHQGSKLAVSQVISNFQYNLYLYTKNNWWFQNFPITYMLGHHSFYLGFHCSCAKMQLQES
jgi:hypothetical protein